MSLGALQTGRFAKETAEFLDSTEAETLYSLETFLGTFLLSTFSITRGRS